VIIPTVVPAEKKEGNGDPFANAPVVKVPAEKTERPIHNLSDLKGRHASSHGYKPPKDKSIDDDMIYASFRDFCEYVLDTTAYDWVEGWDDAIKLVEDRLIHYQGMTDVEKKYLFNILGDLHNIKGAHLQLEDFEAMTEYLADNFQKKVMDIIMPLGESARKYRSTTSSTPTRKRMENKGFTEEDKASIAKQLQEIATNKSNGKDSSIDANEIKRESTN
jgi:hypothetical protein